MITQQEALLQIQKLTDALVRGRLKGAPLAVETFPEGLRPLAESCNRLQQDLQETHRFASALTQGELSAIAPSRANVLASPLKELQSQLVSFDVSMTKLREGKIVSKLYYPGELFAHYNALIEYVASRSFDANGADEAGANVTSWRYHQVLAAINRLRIMLIEVHPDGEIVFMNPPAKEALANSTHLPYGQPNIQDPLLCYLCSFAAYKTTPKQHFPIVYELQDAQGSAWYHITTDEVTLADGTKGLLHVVDDISDRKKNELALEQKIAYDALTGAYTRHAGMCKLEELLAAKEKGHHCIAFVDLDKLKYINDHFGHNEGDYAIRTVAKTLMSSVRETDYVIRLGGDEFLVLFLHCQEDMARAIIERVYQKLEAAQTAAQKPYALAFSVGLTPITPDMVSSTALIELADAAMYEDKQRRRTVAAAVNQ